MATKQSLITYHADSPAIQALISEFGERLSTLSACEKLNLLAIFGDWQEFDTRSQEEGDDPITLSDFLQSDLIRVEPFSSDVERCLEILADYNIGDDSTLGLCVSICHQLMEGYYLK
ncbi:hypothetical protein H6F51_24710 [Cyanobacteria bacterium FACHB-DQ100]|nr:hypothetical protein [Cyanobacteria bacterium FACHB-DQ100]